MVVAGQLRWLLLLLLSLRVLLLLLLLESGRCGRHGCIVLQLMVVVVVRVVRVQHTGRRSVGQGKATRRLWLALHGARHGAAGTLLLRRRRRLAICALQRVGRVRAGAWHARRGAIERPSRPVVLLVVVLVGRKHRLPILAAGRRGLREIVVLLLLMMVTIIIITITMQVRLLAAEMSWIGCGLGERLAQSFIVCVWGAKLLV